MQIKKYLVLLIVCLCLVGCTNKIVEPDVKETPINNIIEGETDKFIKEYTGINSYIEVKIPSETKIHYVTTSEVLNIVTSGTGIIYFGRPTCPWCRNIIPVLANVANKNKMVINYYNPGEVSADDTSNYVLIKEKLSSYLRSDADGNKTFYLPDVYFIKDGKVVGHKLGSVASQTDAYVSLTSDQIQELSNTYQDYINGMK